MSDGLGHRDLEKLSKLSTLIELTNHRIEI